VILVALAIVVSTAVGVAAERRFGDGAQRADLAREPVGRLGPVVVVDA